VNSSSWPAYEASRRQRTDASAGRADVSADREVSATMRASTSRTRNQAALEDEVRQRTAKQVERERAVPTQAEELAGKMEPR
jgi:hypothetical protein